MKFTVSPDEEERIRKWRKEHGTVCPHMRRHASEPFGGIPSFGERWAYEFVPTGLGAIVRCRCILCGAEFLATDVSSW